MKIHSFEHGTMFIQESKRCRFEIPENKVLAECKDDLKDLLIESPLFFTLNEIKKENDRLILDYKMEADFRPIITTKKYSSVLRLSLMNVLLEMDPLNTLKEKVWLHPRNIFFKDMKTLKFLYRSNQWLPFDDHLVKLEQYKILIISMFSRFSYEKYKREKDNLLKREKDEFLFRIENAQSVEDLKELISQRLQWEETNHFLSLETEQHQMKKQKRVVAGLSIGICGLAVGLALFLQQSSVNKVKTAYAMELHKVKQESYLYKLLSAEKYDEALLLLKKNGGSKKEVANVYFKKGEYQEAIDTDKSFIKPVVEALYKSNKKEEIVGLKAESNYLEIEKKIINYNYSSLLSMQTFIKDKNQQIRLGNAFAEHGDLMDAKSLNERINSKELESKIRKIELEQQVATLEQQIKGINENGNMKQKDKQKELDLKNEELENVKTELEKIDKGME
ncbi:type VII secretion protein EssB/YukC [Bacillus salipaludis]|uniref:type VII secretion protein EssB/YukC n=1 Tax=Bacillus salipaludis TaxID=2547811 RepID=UPI002E249892|nr:type VII secretion protein EssB/YukC [Bacillus salipaludis]